LVRKGCRSPSAISSRPGRRTAAGLGGGTIALALDVTDRASFKAFLAETSASSAGRRGDHNAGSCR